MIEVKISLELTKNGIQKTVFAKAGEHGARRIIINLTCNGKVLDVSDAAYDMHLLTQNGTEIDDYAEFCEKEGTGYAFSVPALTEGERIFEVAVSKGEQRLYSPRFRLYSEASYDAESWTEPGEPILYQPILANADVIAAVDMADDDYAIIYDTELEKAVKVLWSSLQYDDSEIRQSMWNIVDRLTDAESAISDRYTKTETNTLLGAKVDKETGKGLSSNDFTSEHITAITNNTAARHTHSNKTVIDKFSENAAGEPLYDGEPIGGGGSTEAVEIWEFGGVSYFTGAEIIAGFANTVYNYRGDRILSVYSEDDGETAFCIYIDNQYAKPVLTAIRVKANKGIETGLLLGAGFSDRNFDAAYESRLASLIPNQAASQYNKLATMVDLNELEKLVYVAHITLVESAQGITASFVSGYSYNAMRTAYTNGQKIGLWIDSFDGNPMNVYINCDFYGDSYFNFIGTIKFDLSEKPTVFGCSISASGIIFQTEYLATANDLNAGNITYDGSQTYGNGTVGKEIASVKSDIMQKQDEPTISSQTAPTAITLADNTEYKLTDVSSLTLTYPIGDFEVWIKLTTASSGTVTISFPTSQYIGSVPTFGNSETWEISIKNGVVVAGKVSANG